MHWRTHNKTMSAFSYHHRSGEVTVPAGSRVAPLTVKFKDNPVWNHEAIITVELKVIKGKANLGELKITTIVVLNEDSFPACAYGAIDPFNPFNHAKCPEVGTYVLVRAFLDQTWEWLHEDGKWGIFYSFFPGITSIVDQLVIMFTINIAIKDEDRQTLGFLVGAFVGSFCIRLWSRNQRRELRLGGKATQKLRQAVFDTMLQFTAPSQDRFPGAAVTTVLSRDVHVVNNQIWWLMFKLVEVGWHLVLQTIMFIMITVLFADQTLWILAIPPAIIVFNSALLHHNHHRQEQLTFDALQRDEEWNKCSGDYGELRDLVTGYRKDAEVSAQFAEAHRAANKATFEAASVEECVIWSSTSFSLLIMAVLLWVLSDGVMEGKTKVGTMVTLVNAVKVLGSVIDVGFESVYDMVNGKPAIERIAALLNADTKRKMLWRARKRREKGLKDLGAAPDVTAGACPGSDSIGIYDLSFTYPPRDEGEAKWHQEEHQKVIDGLDVRLGAGQVVLFKHQSREGKLKMATENKGEGASGEAKGVTTLLRLLARHSIPSQGFISYPGNWRVRFLDAEPHVFPQTLWYNLSFGVQHTRTDDQGRVHPIHTVEEVCLMCEDLGLGAVWVNNHFGVQMGHDGRRVNRSARILISIARALLSSPQLLLIANSLDGLGADDAKPAVRTLCKFVQMRGLPCLKTEYAMTEWKLKKPRTVVFATRIPELYAVFAEYAEQSNVTLDEVDVESCLPIRMQNCHASSHFSYFSADELQCATDALQREELKQAGRSEASSSSSGR